MRIGIPKEVQAHENRVAATPDTVGKLQKLGFDVVVEYGAGVNASFENEAFTQAGAQVVEREEVWDSDIILKVNAPIDEEIGLLNDGATLASFIWPAQNEALMNKLSQRNVNILAMDSVPRLSRSQSLDALSSMANIGGYRAVVEASHEFWSLLQWADHRSGQNSTGQSAGHWCRCCRSCGTRCGLVAWALLCVHLIPARKLKSKFKAWEPTSLRLDYERSRTPPTVTPKR